MNEGPLTGVGVAVTRGEGASGPLSRLLEEEGARVLDWGTIAFAAPEDPAPLLDSLDRIEKYDWVVLSSPRAVDAVVSRVGSSPEGVRVAAVGPSTAEALKNRGWKVDRVPEAGSAEALVELFRDADDMAGARILLPASAIARDVIPLGLTELGARVDRVVAYRMVTLPLDEANCRDAMESGAVRVVTFASPSALEGLRAGLSEQLFQKMAGTLPAAVIGPTTEKAVVDAGWLRIFKAPKPDFAGLVAAVRSAVKAGEGP